MRTLYYETTIHRQIRKKRENRKDRIKNDLQLYGGDVLLSEEMKKAYEQTHHKRSTVGEHTLRVALASVMTCYAFRKVKIDLNIPAVVVGSLCHDLGILGREEKYSSAKMCSREHPHESVSVAKHLVNEIPEKSEEIIRRHMWPVGKSKAPNSIECIVVSLADKYVAIKDIIKGGDSNKKHGKERIGKSFS